MLRVLCRRLYDLDRPVREDDMDPGDPAWTGEFFRHTLQLVLSDRLDAVHLFYHEVDDCVRCCLWRQEAPERGVWYQHVPISAAGGLRLLRELRKRVVARRRQHGRVWGLLRYRWQGTVGAFNMDSPHEWDVRLWRGERRPSTLSYELFFAGERGKRENAAGPFA